MSSAYLTGSVVEGPVGLVLTESLGRTNAMTVTFFSEVAHYPTTLWTSIATSSYTHELIRESGRFSLVVLHRRQRRLAELCGSVSGRDRDKCAHLRVYRSLDGVLFLRDALASIACRVRNAHPLGDHTLFVADIPGGEIDTRRSNGRHLLMADLHS